ncbi:MAG: beta-glucosidase [Chloroflexi bacterium]|nr:beta-glucosidase [Chloroflexota bacterium]
MTEPQLLSFPRDFVWGAGSSAYQIEGAAREDGRAPSVWDTFARRRGRVRNGETGDAACDHYHRWADDIQVMKRLGLKAYRFSVAWPRILPQGRGAVNAAGLDFYERLVDGLLAAGIEPLLTLYHWDLPQPLQDAGGWPKRDTARYFADYATVVAARLGDRVETWITQNEPWVHALVGHLYGEHAPGRRNPFAALAALHHLLLSHGYAVPAIRSAVRRPVKVGIALNLTPVYPASPGGRDRKAMRFSDNFLNRLALEPVLKGQYPGDFTGSRIWRWLTRGVIQPDDLKTIGVPIDFLGINYYYRTVMRYAPIVQSVPVFPKENEYTEMWEIYPTGLYDLLMRVRRDYPPVDIVITENGAAVPDRLEPDGRVHDTRRIRYLRDHVVQLHRAMSDGVPVRGYVVWSLMDNFEWALGYAKRFGLVYVDYATQARILKDSALWYAQVMWQGGVDPRSEQAPAG